jgi:CubicO group peptidase (beta-lactamase class C family)
MLRDFIKTIEENELEVYGIRVIKDGKRIAGHDFRPLSRHPIYSATKSFTSTAVGLALEEKKIDLEDSILTYVEELLPKDCPTEVKDNLNKITIKRLLMMSVSGYPFRPEGEDWLTYSLSIQLKNVENIAFHYSNIPAYLVGVILERALGQKLYDYLTPRLFEPLEIIHPDYMLCPQGHFYGASGMKLTVDELSRLGILYLQQGEWKGKQLLSPEWVREATAKQIETREGGYGYFFWRSRENGYRISGKWGQCCYVFPQKRLVIAYLSNLQDDGKSKLVSNCIYESIYHRL